MQRLQKNKCELINLITSAIKQNSLQNIDALIKTVLHLNYISDPRESGLFSAINVTIQKVFIPYAG